MTQILQVTTTCADESKARHLAREMVEKRFAACAQIKAISSVYMWDNKLCDEPEFEVSFKTVPRLRHIVFEALSAAHTYDLPQIICSDIEASADYRRWVETMVKD